jgi:three-Cys-motif partner protein
MADGESKANGNWIGTGDDGLPVQDIGAWGQQKHDLLQRYIDASAGPRGKFLQPRTSGRPAGGAGYVELFAGPGRARVRETREFVPSSPIIALDHAKQPFTRVVLVELDTENIAALKARTRQYGDRVEIIQGDCNEVIDRVVQSVPRHGLNLALIDHYGLKALQFETIRKLAQIERMDLIIHFPVSDMKRNIAKDARYRGWIDRALGVHVEITLLSDIPKLIENLRTQLRPFGYEQEQVRSVAICNSKKAPLYYLVYVSKHPKGSEIWKSLTKHTGVQRGFDF